MAATHLIRRSLTKTFSLSRNISTSSASLSLFSSARSPLSLIHRICLGPPLGGAISAGRRLTPSTAVRCCATETTSLGESLPPGCDGEHWFVLMEPPQGRPSRQEIIDTYIKTAALVLGSEEEARKKIYSVSTCCYYAFGVLMSEEVSLQIGLMPKVLRVFPDSYLDVKNKDYGGEPFINGEAVPYDKKYHAVWKRNMRKRQQRNLELRLPDGCDLLHWFVLMKRPEGTPTRDEIIHSYIKTLATVVGSEEEARMKLYSVSTCCYYAFSCLVPEVLARKIEDLPRVRCVLPDSYLDVKNKDYGGEPFVNGEALPYHPKYHQEWIRNKADKLIKDRLVNFERNELQEVPTPSMKSMPNDGANTTGMPPSSAMSPPNMGGASA